MLYIKDLNTAFILPQKVASTSIKTALRNTVGVPFEEWKDWERLPENNIGLAEIDHDKDIVVAAVRNPYDRLVSCWHDQAAKGRYGKITGFDNFIKLVCDGAIVDKHVSPYNIEYADYVLRFETLQKNWRSLRRRLPMLKPLGHENKNKKRRHWCNYYNDKTLQMVYRFYQDDFERWGY